MLALWLSLCIKITVYICSDLYIYIFCFNCFDAYFLFHAFEAFIVRWKENLQYIVRAINHTCTNKRKKNTSNRRKKERKESAFGALNDFFFFDAWRSLICSS